MNRFMLPILVVAACCMPTGLAQDKPVPPAEAPHRMTLPEGFQATLFAGEPDVVQPIALAFDDRGRLWVAECLSYPKWIKDGKPGRDRIVIFEDRDGDGRFDARKVFHDRLANLTGLQLGFGGVWACATPNLLFIPDRDGDDVPDGPPEVVLDGWDLNAQHNVFNGLNWGPDGWLYGCNGILSQSRVGKPGTPDRDRVRLNCGVWRYHPTRKQFEVVCTGTTNPWGLDFDDYGEAFITNCVIHHLWHVVPGAHFRRMFGQDFNPHWYELMVSCADHIHWAGGTWQSSRGGQGSHGEAGGGHAHSGAMVYLGDNWPDRYRNGVFMCNIHGSRVNHDRLERRGSGYVARHAKDVLLANDPWFRGIALQYGPDGGVYVLDWTDTGECHNYVEVDRSNGRVYKVSYGRPKPWHGDLAKLTDTELVRLQRHKNDWFVRHARRLLQERAAAGKLAKETHRQLAALLDDERADVRHRLRALWALYVSGGVKREALFSRATEGDPLVRAWALRLYADAGELSGQFLQNLEYSAILDPNSPASLKLAVASVAQRVKPGSRDNLLHLLMHCVTETGDTNLALMVWYAAEPVVAVRPEIALLWLDSSHLPLVREFVARRLAGLSAGGLDRVTGWLARSADPQRQADVLRGVQAALTGARSLPAPKEWAAAYDKLAASASAEVRERATELAVLFGDERALRALRRLVQDAKAPAAKRGEALTTLLQRQPPDFVPVLQELLDDLALRGAAIRGLAAYADDRTPALLLRHYATLPEAEKADAIQTLASRPAYALALLDAVEKGQVPRRDLSAFTVRQMLNLKNADVRMRLNKVWGTIRPASQEKAALMAKYKARLTPDVLKAADRSHGRQVFAKACASCHRLFDDGGAIGPDLTGAQRTDLGYVLENLLDPSAIVFSEYQVTVVETKGGRVVNGIVKQETDKALVLQTQNESVVVPKDEIAAREKSNVSLMPEGLLSNLNDKEVRDLIAYLASSKQVPLPPAAGK